MYKPSKYVYIACNSNSTIYSQFLFIQTKNTGKWGDLFHQLKKMSKKSPKTQQDLCLDLSWIISDHSFSSCLFLLFFFSFSSASSLPLTYHSLSVCSSWYFFLPYLLFPLPHLLLSSFFPSHLHLSPLTHFIFLFLFPLCRVGHLFVFDPHVLAHNNCSINVRWTELNLVPHSSQLIFLLLSPVTSTNISLSKLTHSNKDYSQMQFLK